MITLYPVGDNKSDARSTFDNRKFYKEDIYPTYISQPIDYWYEHLCYGRIDDNSDVVKLKNPEESLRQIKKIEEPLFALNFVVDAFEDFVVHIEKAVVRNLIDPGATIANLKPIRAWENPETLYIDYLLAVRESFFAFLKKNALEDKIVNVNDFAHYFLKFARTIAPKFPVTQTAFLKSKYSTPHIGGLSIEFFLEDHGEDRVKFDEFISSDCYEFYVNAAKKHGFYVDKNAPWRITADIASPRMQEYMSRYYVKRSPGTSSNFFELFYEKTFLTDIHFLIFHVQESFNEFVELNPYAKKFMTLSCGKKTRVRTFRRKKSTAEDALNDFGWYENYYELRSMEESRELIPSVTKRILKKAHELKKVFNFVDGLRYINHKAKSAKVGNAVSDFG